MTVHLVFYFIKLLWLILLAAAITSQEKGGGSDCDQKCGNVTVPFPFGKKQDCYANHWFKFTCNETHKGKKPFISGTNLEIVKSYTDSSVLVNTPVSRINCGGEGLKGSSAVVSGYLSESPFLISGTDNYIGAIGCGNLVTFVDNNSNIIGGCLQPRCGHMTSNGCYADLSLIKSYNLLTVSATISKYYSSDEDEGKRCTSIFLFSDWDLLDNGILPDINNRSTQLTAQLEWRTPVHCEPKGAAPCQQPEGARKQSNCNETCGNITISYPFGMEDARCYKDEWYEVICKKTDNGPTPFIRKLDLQILSISFPYGKILVNHSVSYFSCPKNDTNGVIHKLKGSPFFYSQSWNSFKSTGCGNLVTLFHNQTDLITSCVQPSCGDNVNSNNLTCVMVIPPGINSFIVNMTWDYHGNDGIGRKDPSCGYTFVSATDVPFFVSATDDVPFWITNSDYFFSRTSTPYVANDYLSEPTTTYHPALLEWAKPISGQCEVKQDSKCTSDGKYCWTNLNSTYLCVCSKYENSVSYSSDVCAESGKCKYPSFKYCYMLCFNEPDKYCYMQNPTSSNEKSRDRGIIISFSTSIGTIFVLSVGWGMYKFQKRRKNKKRRQKYFKRNGGLLLQQQLSANKGSNVDRIKLFASKELEKATDHYNENRVLGQGGQGTVYKGMLSDGSIVAIKKSKMVEEKKKLLDDRKLEQFINEVILLSQINHRNVVKLLGCCLETPVPLLVYEFVPNGTLSQLIEDHNDEFPLTWEMRLRIATEIGNALSYVHSSASVPIYHRDIKSSNILLDDKYRAKVSDFGTSKSIAPEQTHLTTKVQGTFGYMDPEYFRSSQFTEKSDVYSFGVVLVELLTGKKPIPSEISEEVRSLVPSFLLSVKENTLFDILDSRMVNNGAEEEIVAVAKLAKRCLNLIGKKRPTMKQVAMELEMIRNSEANGIQQSDDEDVDSDDIIEASTMDSRSTWSAINNSVTSP